MYSFLNLNPNGKFTGDCVKRAIAKAEDKDYMEVQRELNRLKKETGCEKFNDNKNWKTYVNKKGYRKLSFQATKGEPRMNGEMFCKKYPKGRYILRMAGHLTCCIDGTIYDTWDCSRKCVYNAWEVK